MHLLLEKYEFHNSDVSSETLKILTFSGSFLPESKAELLNLEALEAFVLRCKQQKPVTRVNKNSIPLVFIASIRPRMSGDRNKYRNCEICLLFSVGGMYRIH